MTGRSPAPFGPAVVRYCGAGDGDAWNAFVDDSRNGTFLFRREYMTYHAARFVDASLMVFIDGRLAALMPANRDGDTLVSHGGLTYGGLVLDRFATVERVMAVFAAVANRLREDGVRRLVYKTVPWIYHRVPTEEDRYALFRAGARLTRRDVLTVISPFADWQPGRNRPTSRMLRATRAANVVVQTSTDWFGFWRVLEERLRDRFGAVPVHSPEEMVTLAGRFPAHIRLIAGTIGEAVEAGCVLYESARVVHLQYTAASAAARKAGLLDVVLHAAVRYARDAAKWLDFGASNGRDGTAFNAGLACYKESFGGRTVVHDTYEMELR